MDWILSHTSFLQLLVSIATAVIWVVYLQMLLTSLRRQRRSVLTLNRGAGDGFEARIILANLSYEPVFVRDMTVTLHSEAGHVSGTVTDLEEYGQEDMSTELQGTVQGPLGMGDHIDVGSFSGILERFDPATRPKIEAITRFDITIVASRERLTGVRKCYDISRGAQGELTAITPTSYQVETLSEKQCWSVLQER